MLNITTKHRTIFFGSSAASALILEDLLHAPDIEVVAVVTQPPKDHAHAHQRITRVAQLATEHNIALFTPHKLQEITSTLTELEPEIGVLFAYGKILPDETLNLFPKGSVNIHPSLLPRHRGPAPLENTILTGDSQAGTTIMLITSEMDAGPILAQSSFSVDSSLSKQQLWDQLIAESRSLLLPTLRDYIAGAISPQPQDPGITPTYSKLLKKTDGDIDPEAVGAAELIRIVRAYAGWPGVRLPVSLRGKILPLTLHEVRQISSDKADAAQLSCQNKQLILHLKDGSVEILRAQLPNKATVSGQDICNAGPIELA
jgi:methionyl-tRNA formyltransferase